MVKFKYVMEINLSLKMNSIFHYDTYTEREKEKYGEISFINAYMNDALPEYHHLASIMHIDISV